MAFPKRAPKGKKKKEILPHPPYLPSQGWNAGKGDCGYYRSQLGFCINRHRGRGSLQKGGTGFIQDGGYSREEPGRPLSHIYPGPYSSFQRTYQNSLFKELA